MPDFKLVLEPRAMELLKASGARLAVAKAMSFTAAVGYEYPSRLGPPILYTVRYDVAMMRPDKLKIVTVGDGPASEFVYDGKEMLAYAPAADLLAVAAAPPGVEGALQAAFTSAAIFYPFTDLLVDDPYAALTHKAKLAFIVGRSNVVGGVTTDIVAWANDDVFLQMWIGVDDRLPRRIRAMYRADPMMLRHEMELTNWKLDMAGAGDVAASDKARGGRRIPFANPAGTPVPQGARPIGAQPVGTKPVGTKP